MYEILSEFLCRLLINYRNMGGNIMDHERIYEKSTGRVGWDDEVPKEDKDELSLLINKWMNTDSLLLYLLWMKLRSKKGSQWNDELLREKRYWLKVKVFCWVFASRFPIVAEFRFCHHRIVYILFCLRKSESETCAIWTTTTTGTTLEVDTSEVCFGVPGDNFPIDFSFEALSSNTEIQSGEVDISKNPLWITYRWIVDAIDESLWTIL